MEKTVSLAGRDYRMRASALIPRIYRAKFGRDLISDIKAMQDAIRAAIKEKRSFADAINLETLENIAWTMIHHAGEQIPDDPAEWLGGIDDVFAIYNILPDVLDLWNGNQKTTAVSKKK